MLVNLTTLEIQDDGGPVRVMAWAPPLERWVVLVKERSPQPPLGVLELTIQDFSEVMALQKKGLSPVDAFRQLLMKGGSGACPNPGV